MTDEATLPTSIGENSPPLFHALLSLVRATSCKTENYLSGQAFGMYCCIYDTRTLNLRSDSSNHYGFAQIALRRKVHCIVLSTLQQHINACGLHVCSKGVLLHASNLHRTALRYGCRPSRFLAVTSITRSGYECCSKTRS